MYDLTGNGSVDREDMDAMIRKVIGTEYGDANLDGVVDAEDANVMFSNMFSDATGWSAGDFNGDNVVDGRDMILWNDHKQLAPTATFEPASEAATEPSAFPAAASTTNGADLFVRMDGASNHDLVLTNKRAEGKGRKWDEDEAEKSKFNR